MNIIIPLPIIWKFKQLIIKDCWYRVTKKCFGLWWTWVRCNYGESNWARLYVSTYPFGYK